MPQTSMIANAQQRFINFQYQQYVSYVFTHANNTGY